MIVGDKGYQLNLSRLAFNFKGAVDMGYLQGASADRVKELSEHSKIIAGELQNSGQ